VETILAIKKDISEIHLEIKQHTKLVEEEARIMKPKVGTKPLVVV
jgi:hypothetical protein